MSIIRRTKRPKRANRRLDLSAMREVLRDQRVWCGLGLVVKDGDSHWRFDEDDVLVEVELQPSEERMTCRLGSVAGGSAHGVWAVPPEGTEVAVLIPDGEFEAEPIIVATLSSGALPASEGVGEDRTIIVNGEVLIHDGSGGTEPLVKKSEFDAHTHTTTATVNTGSPGVLSAPDNSPITGTTILKAK